MPSNPLLSAGSGPVYLFLATATAILPMLLAATGLRIAIDEFAMFVAIIGFAIWLSLCLRGRGLPRIATAVEASAAFSLACLAVTLMTFVIATTGRPYQDLALAHADLIMLPGWSWPDTMMAFSTSGWPLRVANFVYQSIGWQSQLLILVLSWQGRDRQVWRFIAAWILTLCVVMLGFALWPAVGAYTHYGIAAGDVPGIHDPTPWQQPVILDGLRTGSLRFIDLSILDGIVQFPSFHAGAAVLLGHAFWQVRPLRWPFAALNALMFASAVPVGGHYVVDLPVGALTAWIGIAAASRLDAAGRGKAAEPWASANYMPAH